MCISGHIMILVVTIAIVAAIPNAVTEYSQKSLSRAVLAIAMARICLLRDDMTIMLPLHSDELQHSIAHTRKLYVNSPVIPSFLAGVSLTHQKMPLDSAGDYHTGARHMLKALPKARDLPTGRAYHTDGFAMH